MDGNVLAAATAVLLVLVLVGVQRVLPRHDVAVPIGWAVVVFAAWESVDPFSELMLSNTAGALVGMGLALTIAIASNRSGRQGPPEPVSPPAGSP
jgi:hypothetical protein